MLRARALLRVIFGVFLSTSFGVRTGVAGFGVSLGIWGRLVFGFDLNVRVNVVLRILCREDVPWLRPASSSLGLNNFEGLVLRFIDQLADLLFFYLRLKGRELVYHQLIALRGLRLVKFLLQPERVILKAGVNEFFARNIIVGKLVFGHNVGLGSRGHRPSGSVRASATDHPEIGRSDLQHIAEAVRVHLVARANQRDARRKGFTLSHNLRSLGSELFRQICIYIHYLLQVQAVLLALSMRSCAL